MTVEEKDIALLAVGRLATVGCLEGYVLAYWPGVSARKTVMAGEAICDSFVASERFHGERFMFIP